MKDSIKHYAARLVIRTSKAVSRALPVQPVRKGDLLAVRDFCEWQYFHFGVLDNPHCEERDPERWAAWDSQARRIIKRTEEAWINHSNPFGVIGACGQMEERHG